MLQELRPYGPDRSRWPTWSCLVIASEAAITVAIALSARSDPLVQ